MTSYLQKFQAQSKLRVAIDLQYKWESSAHCYGAKEVKVQIANAKRVSTALKKAVSTFADVKPEHRLSLDAAANAMQALVAELSPLVPWAESYKKFCDQERAIEHGRKLQSIAATRWPDEAAYQFELAIMKDLSTRDGAEAFAEWIRSTNRYPQSQSTKFVSVFQRMADGASDRERAASTVYENNSSRAHSWADTQFCGWDDYESYLAFRGAVAKAAERAVQTASIQIQHNEGSI
jgi:hypothetical protein